MALTDSAGARVAPVIDARKARRLRARRLEKTLRWALPLALFIASSRLAMVCDRLRGAPLPPARAVPRDRDAW